MAEMLDLHRCTRFALRWGLRLLTLYAVYALILFLLQRQLLYPGRHRCAPPPGRDPLRAGLERIWLDLPAGPLETWFFSGDLPEPAPAVIFAHGNGELIDDWPQALEPLRALGLGLLLLEYPGYGRSSGSPDEQSITAAMVAAYDALAVHPGVDPTRIFAYGRSLGGGAACALAARRPVAALILQSTFRSLRPFARRYFLPSFLLRDHFDNEEALRRYDGPVLILHGARDRLVPISHARALAAAATNAELRIFEGGHNKPPPDPGFPQHWIEAFLRSHHLLD